MIPVINVNVSPYLKQFLPKKWANAALLATASAVVICLLKNQFSISKGVRFDGKPQIRIIQPIRSDSPLPQGYKVYLPKERIAILEKIDAAQVTIRFQNDKEELHPDDSIILTRKMWDSFEKERVW